MLLAVLLQSSVLHAGGRKAIPPMLTWDLSTALAQLRLRSWQPHQPADGVEGREDGTGASMQGCRPRSPAKGTAADDSSGAGFAGITSSDAPDAVAMPRRPSLGSILRAVSLPCQPSDGDDPTVSPCSEPATPAKAQVRLAWSRWRLSMSQHPATLRGSYAQRAQASDRSDEDTPVRQQCPCPVYEHAADSNTLQAAAGHTAESDRQPTSAGSFSGGFVSMMHDALGRLPRIGGSPAKGDEPATAADRDHADAENGHAEAESSSSGLASQ